jgi:hypothetical protein
LSRQQPPTKTPDPVPDTQRSDNGADGPTGIPSWYGAVGRRFSKGF